MTVRPNLTVNVFPGGFNWGLYVGIDRGFFAHNGVDVTISATPNSVAQMTGLSEGRFEIAMTAVDNIVAYVEGQGEAPIGAQPDFFAFMGSDSGFLSLVVRSNIERVADLAGRTLSVDAMTTGYAFVLLEILRRYGLQRGEFQIRKVGGMAQRYNSLLDGGEDGTLLSAPYSTLAKHHGLTELVKATSLLGSYQGNVAAARRSWASENETQVIAFIRGYREAITWLYEPAHREDAIGILMRNLPQMPRSLAEATYTELLSPDQGFFRDCAIDLRGMDCVLDLRSRYCGREETLRDPMKYCDLSYYRWATG
ncbi:MAG TPA: ABC transporter substrate-binding protein [Xanthobacteraceae bacterium]|nr:ABC transporter substrate-binding protein [Xanthobacteraceae bacterium]